MKNPKTIDFGEYKTTTELRCYVYQWSKNILDEWCYFGTIEGIGLASWDQDGKDKCGVHNLKLD